ncbi:MAG: MGMT family protein [Schleiferiaceae bacterium]|nr:MGMT family protein [Schleiferiaceae bacterium]
MAAVFYERVYWVVRQIPEGRVTTYGAIAKAIYSPKSARMVGYALNASKNNSDIPAHRVVNRKGLLTGKFHFGGQQVMQELLANEGVEVVDNQIKDIERYFWDPIHEVDLEYLLENFQQNVEKL